MIILETGFGDRNEAFIEKRLTSGVNIIFSDDNNKGKTLVIQGMMYSLGNEPIFPSGFNYRQYHFYTKVEADGNIWSIIRKNSSFIVRSDDEYHAIDSVSEFKRFFNAKIHLLPTIVKDETKKLVELSLFFQLFFLPQDKRDTSNIIEAGYLKKTDFIQMLYALQGAGPVPLDDDEIRRIKADILDIEEQIRLTTKRFVFAKKYPRMAEFATKTGDREALENTKAILSSINIRISESKKKRSKEINRKQKLERLINELNSLNRELSVGHVICGECGSKLVFYKKDEYSFDVSNKTVRNEILGSIREEIGLKAEIIEELTRDINNEQTQLAKHLEVMPKPIQTLLLQTEEILSVTDIDNALVKLNCELQNRKRVLADSKKIIENTKETKSQILRSITEIMNSIYREMDPDGNLYFGDLFTKRGETYSGSEEQEFYFSKLIALSHVLNHDNPIIVDSFRDGELSSGKEAFMIQKYIELNKQVILTSTLKEEEYSSLKYESFVGVNSIDYSNHITSHILNSQFARSFNAIMTKFNL